MRGEVEVADLGAAQVGAGSLGLHSKLHYVVLVAEEIQRLSVLMGWAGPGQEMGGHSWSAEKERGLYRKKQCYIKFSLQLCKWD